MSTPVQQLLDSKGHEVETIQTTSSVYDALKIMDEKRIGCLLVMTKQGTLSGIISERDCVHKAVILDRAIHDMQVRQVMTPKRKLICVTPDVNVDTCRELMTEKRVRHLPVVTKKGKIVGIVSIGDVVKHMGSERDLLIRNLEYYISGSI